jgi:hypothetical protein
MKHIAFSILIALTLPAAAQRISLQSGSVAPLKDQNSINVEFYYDANRVGKFKTEDEYIKSRKRDLNDKKAGRGDEWEKKWFADRKERFEPKFLELFSKETGWRISPDAPYTLMFSTVFTEPGFNVYAARRNAYISAEALVVKTGTKDIVAKILVVAAPGRTAMGYDFDTGGRIQEAYAISGKKLGRFIMKLNKK